MPDAPKRTAIATLRRDVNSEYIALARVTRESLAKFAARIVRLELVAVALAAVALAEGGVIVWLALR